MFIKPILAATLLALGSQTGNAQSITLATPNAGGFSHQIGSAIAKVVSESTDVRMVVVPFGQSPNPVVAGGEAECGINTAYDVAFYANGTSYYQNDEKHPGLRMVAAVLPSLTAMYVAKDSGINSIADLKGKRVPGGLSAQLAILAIYDAVLQAGGTNRDEVETIPARNIVQGADDFAAGRADAFMFSVGTAKVLEVDSAVGGLQALSIQDTPEVRENLKEALPSARLTELNPTEQVPQIVGPTNVLTVDMALFCADTVPDDVIYEIVKATHANKQGMAEIYAGMSRFEPDGMAVELPSVSYHPGAIRFYEEAGIWPPKG